jgi:hypothetical protein
MKANWKIALMCVAAIAFVACNNKKDPSGGGGGEEGEYVKPISVSDNSLADWDKLPAEFVVEAKCPQGAGLLGLKSVKAYADKYYIFLQVEPNPEDIVDLEWVPFHVYINTDNSDATGGYSDQFKDPNADVLLEGAVFGNAEASSLAEAAIPWAPGVFKWWGEVGGSGWQWTDPSVEHSTDDKWGAIIGEGELQGTTSQFVNGKFEIEIMRELVPAEKGWSEEQIGLGFDIQQNWQSVGVLPAVKATDDNPNGLTAKLIVKINK